VNTNWRCIGQFYNDSLSNISQGSVKEIGQVNPDVLYYDLYRQALLNPNFDVWSFGTTFSNPADGTITANAWKVRKANGTGTAPSVNVSQGTLVPNYSSALCAQLQCTSAGVTGTGQYWELVQVYASPDFEKFRGQTVSFQFGFLHPLAVHLK
jgi:hypothetical protein